jgi:hypothetical protein
MILAILKFVHVVSGAVGIGAGAWVVFGILKGKLFKNWTFVFLRCALVASVTGLLFPFHHFLPTHWAAMSAVYISGVAVLAWRRCHLTDIWALIFALSIMLVLCVDVLVVIAHIFEKLIPVQPKMHFIIAESMVMLLFLGLKLFTMMMYRVSQAEPTVRTQVNGCN